MSFLIVFSVTVAVSTVLFAAALWLLSQDDNNPFREYGVGATWARCAALIVGIELLEWGIVALVAATGSGLIAFLGVIVRIAAWFFGIMLLFERTFVQAILLTIAMWGIGFLLAILLGAVE